MNIGHAYLHLAAAAGLLMLAMWLFQTARRNATIVDVAWAGGLLGAVAYFASVGQGDATRRLALAAVAGIWAARLTWHLLWDRVVKRWQEEDGRYARMRAAMGGYATPGFLVFFQVQAGFILLFALPFAATAWNPLPFGTFDVLAILVGLGAIVGEALADRQLAAFKADPANRGRTCDQGLWRYSRHPNYFFECVHWFAYLLFCVGSPTWYLALGGPVVMYLFIMYLTGIPHTEAQALSHRPDYADYQRRTNRFFPWKPRSQP